MCDPEMPTTSENVTCDMLNTILARLDVFEQALQRAQLAYLSIEQAASLTGLSTKHIRRAVKKGELACSNVGGEKRPTYRIPRDAIEGWMRANRVRQAPTKSERDALVDRYFGKRPKRQEAAC